MDRLDLPKEGTFFRGNREEFDNYIWKKEWENLQKQLWELVSQPSFSGDVIDSYTADFHTAVFHGETDWKDSMPISHEYSIRKYEKYAELVEHIELDEKMDDYLYAA